MPNIYHMKVADVIAKSFGAYKDLDVKASPSKPDKYDISITGDTGSKTNCSIIIGNHEIELIIENKYFLDEKTFLKWLKKLEYEMEQSYVSNIKTRWSIAASKYLIDIEL